MSDVNIRGLVADSLLEMEREDIFLSALETAVLDKYDYIDVRDKAFYKRLLDGTVERRIRIDYILNLFSSTPVKKMKPYIRAVMRMSVYQIIWMDSIPDAAACNEAVKLVVKHHFSGLRGFVNGVLRNISRNKADIKYPSKDKEINDFLSVIYSCPVWLVNKLIREHGSELTEKILEAGFSEHPLSVRLRVSGAEKENLLASWRKAGVKITQNPLLEYGVFLENTGSVSGLNGFEEGKFTVQDTGSMLVAHLADIHPGNICMDVCAAPGGKSMHAADLCKPDGYVYSYDVSQERCIRIEENIDRLSIPNISVEAHDATLFIPEMENKADIVFVDAPCSGIGVIGHKSDIKYRINEEDILSLQKLQRDILDTAYRYVKVGGKLVYSTCTISSEENEEQVEYILNNLPLKTICIEEKPFVQLLPGQDMSDGFFIALFERKE